MKREGANQAFTQAGLTVVGARQCDGEGSWSVLVLVKGTDGALVQAVLTSEAARAAAAELTATADLIDQGWQG